MGAREVVSSVGAGGSLIAAGVVCLLLFSSLLAFRAWPDRAPSSPDGSATLRAPAPKADGRVATGPLLVADLAPGPVAAPDSGERDRPRRPRPAPPAPDVGGAPRAEPFVPVSTAPGTGASPSGEAAEPASGGGGAPTARPPGPVESLAGAGRNVVEPLVEQLPPEVQEPAGAVLDTTEAAAQTVDETVGPLLP